MTARAQIHHLVDALPDDALDAVERMLAKLLVPTVSDDRPGYVTIPDQAVVALAPTEVRPSFGPAEAAEERLHGFFRRFEGRSLADELIAERREEGRGESS